MPDIESQPQSDGASEAANRNRAKATSAAHAAQDTVKAEQRSFAEVGQSARAVGEQAAEQARAAAQTGLKAGQDLAAAGQEAMRKASGQAVDLWRSSLDPLAHMQNEMGRWFEQTWRQGLTGRLQGSPIFGEGLFAALAGAPMADLYETPEGLELMVELPGLAPQDVQLSLKGDVLTVSGERSEIDVREEGTYRVRERRSGSFQRSFALPAGVDREHIQAHFDKGMLTVSIPRGHGLKAAERSIPIKG
jgi:HSP20 family protein